MLQGQGIQSVHTLASRHQPKFSAYRVDDAGVRFIVPGRHWNGSDDHQMLLEYHRGDSKSKVTIPMSWDGKQWILPDKTRIKNDTPIYYAFIEQKGKAQTRILDITKAVDNYNFIPANSSDPTSLGPTLLVFRDSLVTPGKLEKYLAEEELVQGKRNHFNLLGGNDEANDVLRQINKMFGFKLIEDRPLIGADDLSAHGYWTRNLFQLSKKVSKPSGFEKLAMDSLVDGSRMCFDGAFVNEGLNGIHYLANLYYGQQSPYLNWFDYGKMDQFPHKPLQLGVLPIMEDNRERINHAAWDIRFLDRNGAIITNDRKLPAGPVYVQLYDPRFEEKNGQPKANPQLGRKHLTNSQASVQRYSFPISQAEYQQKKKELAEASRIQNTGERENTIRRLKQEWKAFRLVESTMDGSAYKWDGQRDVAKINTSNPEVQAYIKNACVYWTDKVDRLYTTTVGRELLKARANAPNWIAAVEQITRKDTDGPGLLPPLNKGEPMPVSLASIEKELKAYEKARKAQKLPAQQFIGKQLKDHFRLETLSVSPMLQALFSMPRMHEIATEGVRPLIVELAAVLLHPITWTLDKLFPNAQPGRKLLSFFTPKSITRKFEDGLGKALQGHQKLQAKLKDPVLGHLFYEEIGRSLYLSLLTGRYIPPNASDADLDPAAIGKAINQRLPEIIHTLPPNQAARQINLFLQKELKRFDFNKLVASLEGMYAGLNGEAAVVGRHVLHKRHMGLHWRIDAMKDIGDMDGTRDKPHKTFMLDKADAEFKRVKDIMRQISEGIHGVFPQSVIKGEVTMLFEMTDNDFQKADDYLRYMTEGKDVNGIPAINWSFAGLLRAVRAAMMPEWDTEQISPAGFARHPLRSQMATLPMEQALFYQNMTTSHDHSTNTYGLTMHPFQGRHEYIAWIGLDDIGENRGLFRFALNELQHKKTKLAALRQGIPDKGIETFRQLINSKRGAIEAAINSNENDKNLIWDYLGYNGERGRTEIPLEARTRYVDIVFDTIKPSELGMTPEQHTRFRNVMKALILEPGEYKAVRGKIANIWAYLAGTEKGVYNHSVDLTPLTKATGLGQAQIQSAMKAMTPAFNKALWDLGQSFSRRDQRWLAYQQLDFVIDRLIRKMADDANKAGTNISPLLKTKPARDALKQVLYHGCVIPALEQYKRITAINVAMPGDPTLYLPDLLGQAGGESVKNMYVGDRELIRYDWLKTDPVIAKYCQELGAIVKMRENCHVLNNGHVELPLDPDRPRTGKTEEALLNQSSIFPMVRDNGTDQAICLVNFGAPTPMWDSWKDSQGKEHYPEISTRKPTVSKYKLNLQYLGIAPGTLYEAIDPETKGKEYYVVKPNYQLARIVNPGQAASASLQEGIDVRIMRTLQRVNREPLKFKKP